MVPPAVVRAAEESAVARNPIRDLEKYGRRLQRYIADTDSHLQRFIQSGKAQ